MYPTFKHKYDFCFDFEMGYLVKSPCKECELLPELPECSDECDVIDQIHDKLSHVISCSRRR